MKKVDTSLIVRLCLPQFAVGLFTAVAGSIFCILAILVLLQYKEKDVLQAIEAGKGEVK